MTDLIEDALIDVATFPQDFVGHRPWAMVNLRQFWMNQSSLTRVNRLSLTWALAKSETDSVAWGRSEWALIYWTEAEAAMTISFSVYWSDHKPWRSSLWGQISARTSLHVPLHLLLLKTVWTKEGWLTYMLTSNLSMTIDFGYTMQGCDFCLSMLVIRFRAAK